MEKKYHILFDEVEKNSQAVLDCERHIWNHPETGFREWKTHAYLKTEFEKLGYELHEAGNIPGFYTDIETGRPGPKIAVFGEMDGLIIPTHPECDPETGAVHACGHHCQCAALLGLAYGLKADGALRDLCGSIRLIAVPAEEGIELEFRRSLRKEGTIRYLTGKREFLYRGYLDGVDIAMMVHTSSLKGAGCNVSSNGNMVKKAIFSGKSAHAGGEPYKGVNALYAATTALNVANALREVFREKDTVRFHPIISQGGTSVNAIPDRVVVESYIRAKSIDKITYYNQKINRCFAASAAAMGCGLYIEEECGYSPRINNEDLCQAFYEVSKEFFDESELRFKMEHGTGSSDMGDISSIIPAVHPFVCGAKGAGHSDNFKIVDPVSACVTSAKIQAGVIALLLSDSAAYANRVIENAVLPYESKEAFFKAMDALQFEGEAVQENTDGTVTLRYHQ